ncbi:MAG: DUF3107 domain-containing protein [Acidimicrobiia bacterium]
MDVRIGITYTARELEIELADDADPAAVKAAVDAAMADGGVLWLTDRRGRQIGVSVEKVAYVELGSDADKGRIGFGT